MAANNSLMEHEHKDYAKREPHKKKLLRYLRRKEVVLCTLGSVTFLAGLILIVVAVITMKNGCEVPSGSGSGDGQSRPVWSYNEKSQNISLGHINLAAGKPAYQSTSERSAEGAGEYNASLATDSIHGHHLTTDGCAQTQVESRPYWYVDLGRSEVIKRVEIVGGDCCVGELHNFEIRVGESEDLAENSVCREHLGTALKLTISIVCERHIYGRYVSIQILGDEARRRNRLTLCDVMVYGG